MSFMKELFARFSLHEGQSKSAELAYFFLLSLFPLIIFILTLTAYLPISAEDVLGAVDQYAPDSAMSMVKSITEQTLNKRGGGLLSFGIIAVIWSASNGMNAIVRAFNHAYEVEENRSFIIIRLTSIFLTIAMVVTILIALLLPVFGREIGLLAADFIGAPGLFLQVWSVVRWGISPLILLIVFTALYIFAPNKGFLSALSLPGAVFAADRLDYRQYAVLILRRHFCQLQRHIREHRGNYRPYDLVLPDGNPADFRRRNQRAFT